MRKFITLLLICLSLTGWSKGNSYIDQDYYEIQELIYLAGDSITDINYNTKCIKFVNKGYKVYYSGTISFNKNWISTDCVIIFNYKIDINEYISSLDKIKGIKVFGKNKYVIDNIIYTVNYECNKFKIKERKFK